jgi:uncharacterized repeat protein (TIGR03803 family)
MKPRIKHPSLLLALMAGVGLITPGQAPGQTFTTLHAFSGGSDGAQPLAGLVLSSNTLYGTASTGGTSQKGTVFKVNKDGKGFATLHTFTGAADGSVPYAGLVLSSNILYGTTQKGGSTGQGTVFSLALAPVNGPQLTIVRSEANVSLTWPTNATGFALQSTTNLVPRAVWTSVSQGPVVVNGQNAVTNSISGPQRFYRLSQ